MNKTDLAQRTMTAALFPGPRIEVAFGRMNALGFETFAASTPDDRELINDLSRKVAQLRHGAYDARIMVTVIQRRVDAGVPMTYQVSEDVAIGHRDLTMFALAAIIDGVWAKFWELVEAGDE